jgi:hypothetical protein
MRLRFLCAGLLLALQLPVALACGHCVEDKIASVYDHAVVMRAIATRHHVVFFGIEGRLAGSEAERRLLQQVADSAYGVDPGTARVSTATASLSVAVDPAHRPVADVARSLRSKLARRGLTLVLLRVMDGSSVPKATLQPLA